MTDFLTNRHIGISESDEEKMLVENRYFKDLTQSEVAKIMDVNQVYVSRMEKKVLKKMKSKMTS